MVSIGEMRHSVVLEKRDSAPAATLGVTHIFRGVGDAWCKIEGVGSATYQDGVQIGERITHRITMRYRQRQDFDHISRGDQRFRVQRMRDPDGTRRRLVVEAEEILPGTDDV